MKVVSNCSNPLVNSTTNQFDENAKCQQVSDKAFFNNSLASMKLSTKLKHRSKAKNNILPLPIKSTSTKCKHRTSVDLDICDSNYSQIAKRLYSLVNASVPQYPLKHSTSFNTIINSNSIIDKVKFNEQIRLNQERNQCEGPIGHVNSSSQDHIKLRGFLKQISVEKSGLPVEHNESIISKVLKSKIKNEKFKDSIKTKFKENFQRTNLVTSDSSTLIEDEIDTNTLCKNDVTVSNLVKSSNNNHNKISLLNPDKMNNKKSNRVIKDRNMNSSNCNEIKRNGSFVVNKSLSSSPISIEKTIESISLEKLSEPKKDMTILSSISKLDSDLEYKFHDESHLKRSSYLNKFQRFREKSKPIDNTKMKNESFKICSSQKKYHHQVDSRDLHDVTNGDKTKETSSVDITQRMSMENIKSNFVYEKLKVPSNKGDIQLKPRVTFSKILFGIFSQSGQISKKKKFFLTCTDAVTGIAIENLINLIAILSVELILTSNQTKNFHSKGNVSSKVNQSVRPKRDFNNDLLSDDERQTPNSFKPITKHQTTNSLSLHNTHSPLKNLTLTFDFNGRLITNHNRNPQGTLNNRIHHGSLNNLQNSFSKNSSTLSIPFRYCNDDKVLKSQKLLSCSIDRNSFNSSQLLTKRTSNCNLFHEDIRNRVKGDSRILSLTPNQEMINKRKLNYQETYQFKLQHQHLKKKAKENFHLSHETSPVKSASLILQENKGGSIKLFQNNFPFRNLSRNHSPDQNMSSEILENKNYKFSTQIKSRLDFLKLDEIFSLKEELYNKCDRSSIFIRQNNGSTSVRIHLPNGQGNPLWFLHIESPTTEALKCSISIVANRFPEWNLQQYIDN